jgi:hypothetical protein
MAQLTRTIAVAVAVTATLALAAPPASAATTTVNGTSSPYSGSIQATLVSPTADVTTSLGGGSCTASQLSGTVQSDGTALNLGGATFTGCDTAVVVAQNLPWNNGNITYAPVEGGRDGTLTIAGFRVQATVTSWFGTITCAYGGNITANFFNPANAARPYPAVTEAQAALSGASVSKTGGSFLCPGSATVTAAYQVLGETTAGSGTFDQSLNVTS